MSKARMGPRILAVASEVFPVVKTGGLADVVGALPGALAHHGIEMRVMVPGYPAVMAALGEATPVRRYGDLFGGPGRILSGRVQALKLLVVDAPHLFDRPGNPYLGPDGKDWPDNWQRFAALSRAAADAGEGAIKEFNPEIVQVHDWQAALTASYLAFASRPRPRQRSCSQCTISPSRGSSRRPYSPPLVCLMLPSPSMASNIMAASAT
jgi:starch synthase